MIKYKIFFLTIFVFLTQCGYQTIYSNKDSNFNIGKIKIICRKSFLHIKNMLPV